MNFASDNAAGIAPAIREALSAASEGFALGYGADEATLGLERQLAELFEHEVAVFLVSTGTAANALALAQLCPPWGAVVCHAEAHIVTDECAAPEFFGGGLRLIGVPGVGGRITPEVLTRTIARWSGHRPHQSNAAVLSLTQATEAGTVYDVAAVQTLSAIAHRHGLSVHMDGARFVNALARLGATPAEASWRAGVDVLSFGATKGGAMAAEAVIFFDPAKAEAMAERRKRAGHLLSKHRFIAAQMAAFLADDYGLGLARHANAMAGRLADGLTAAGRPPALPVEANIVFVALPQALDVRLRAAGARYYVRQIDSLPPDAEPDRDAVLARLVTSFATTEADVDAFVALVRSG